jgi:hypothetical protein
MTRKQNAIIPSYTVSSILSFNADVLVKNSNKIAALLTKSMTLGLLLALINCA